MSRIFPKADSIPVIIGSLKSVCTKAVNRKFPRFGFQWQQRYYDHIIRNEKSLYQIRQYIENNPLKWHLDKLNPQNFKNL